MREMSTVKGKVLCGGSALLALLLVACAGRELSREPELHSAPQNITAYGWTEREGHTDFVRSVAISSDGRRALSGGRDKTLRLWDLATGNLLRTFKAKHKVRQVAISPDGRRAFSVGNSSYLHLWDLATGRRLRRFGFGGDVELYFTLVESVAISPDGRRALSGSTDGALRLWDLATGKHFYTFRGHTDSVGSVAISPDGRRALSGSDDKT